jgi:hypothetical protein
LSGAGGFIARVRSNSLLGFLPALAKKLEKCLALFRGWRILIIKFRGWPGTKNQIGDKKMSIFTAKYEVTWNTGEYVNDQTSYFTRKSDAAALVRRVRKGVGRNVRAYCVRWNPKTQERAIPEERVEIE